MAAQAASIRLPLVLFSKRDSLLGGHLFSHRRSRATLFVHAASRRSNGLMAWWFSCASVLTKPDDKRQFGNESPSTVLYMHALLAEVFIGTYNPTFHWIWRQSP